MAEETVTTATQAPTPAQAVPAQGGYQGQGGRGGQRGQRGGSGGGRPGGRRDTRAPRVKPEFEQKIIQIRRVTRVIAGGKRFNFSVAMVIGNRNGSVGVGLGKGGDTSLAIEKAFRHAKKHMLKLALTETKSLPHEVSAKYASARVHLKPSPGRGLIAGSAVRDVLNLAGVVDVNAKIVSSSKNKLNIARGAMAALATLKARTLRAPKEKITIEAAA
ncbi:MAG: hypothetical protein A2542_01340 [Parcubacteria group bacterium RIFOXYD2_FULL_52_8]|nr:MAG: hypothetical protein A2542_01340 [Parcubacteria group bacterium RIFOXYD2_FULL_52_8]